MRFYNFLRRPRFDLVDEIYRVGPHLWYIHPLFKVGLELRSYAFFSFFTWIGTKSDMYSYAYLFTSNALCFFLKLFKNFTKNIGHLETRLLPSKQQFYTKPFRSNRKYKHKNLNSKPTKSKYPKYSSPKPTIRNLEI